MRYTDGFGRDYPEENILTCVGPGWHGIIRRLLHDLERLGWNGEVHQVKEKFGGLRFYIGEGTKAVFDRIDEAESESYRTCETCGRPGKLRGSGWVFTACDKCAEERK